VRRHIGHRWFSGPRAPGRRDYERVVERRPTLTPHICDGQLLHPGLRVRVPVGRRLPAPGRGLVWRAVLRQNGTLTLVRHLGSPLHHGSDSSSIDAKRHEKLSNGYNNERPDAPRGRPMPDAPLTPHEFRIELGDLRAAIGVVQRERAAISASVQLVKTEFGKASEAWNTPAAAGYED